MVLWAIGRSQGHYTRLRNSRLLVIREMSFSLDIEGFVQLTLMWNKNELKKKTTTTTATTTNVRDLFICYYNLAMQQYRGCIPSILLQGAEILQTIRNNDVILQITFAYSRIWNECEGGDPSPFPSTSEFFFLFQNVTKKTCKKPQFRLFQGRNYRFNDVRTKQVFCNIPKYILIPR